MRTVSIDLYKYDKLPDDKARERARDWYRETSAGDTFWSESVLEDARAWLHALGFRIPVHGFRWSGFWSQGDGASFLGEFRAEWRDDAALSALMADRPAQYTDDAGTVHVCEDNATWHAFAGRLCGMVDVRAPVLRATLTVGNWHYCHAHTVRIDCEEEHGGIGNEFADVCRAMMGQIYRELESAYTWETSDETIAENIRANEYEFTIDGARYA